MKKSYLLVLAAVVLVGCSKSEINEVNDDVQIALRSDIVSASGQLTRAPFEGVLSATNVLEARVVTSATENFSGAAYANGIMKFNNATLAANYETDGLEGTSTFQGTASVYVYGLYPKGWTVATPAASAEFTFNGSDDVMAAAKVSTSKADVDDAAYKTLSFKHLLTRLEVKLSAGAAAIPLLGNVSAIRLIGDADGTAAVNNQVVVSNTGASPVPTFSSASATSLNFYGLDDTKAYTNTVVSSYTLTTIPTFVGYSLVAPVTAGASEEEYFLEVVTIDGGSKKFAVDLLDKSSASFEGSTAGKSFVLAIHFVSVTHIAVTATVEDWDEQGEWAKEVPTT
jgi:hypothetical protein